MAESSNNAEWERYLRSHRKSKLGCSGALRTVEGVERRAVRACVQSRAGEKREVGRAQVPLRRIPTTTAIGL